MKKILLFALTMLVSMTVSAQGILQVEDQSNPNDVYTSTNDQAALRIRCHHDIPLSFSSSMDKTANPFNTVLEGSDSIYYIDNNLPAIKSECYTASINRVSKLI